MSAANGKGIKWQQIVAMSLVCGFAVAGCNRSDKDDAEVVPNDQSAVDNSTAATAVACNDPLVEDRLNRAIKNSLQQQAQSIAANYANSGGVSIDDSAISTKLNGIKIKIKDTAIIQGSNANGMTTCQASVSVTMQSEDLYQASQVHAANNLPSLQTRIGRANLGVSNNTLTDNNFTYTVGAQSGQVQARITGQPELIPIVADVMIASQFKTAIDSQRAQQPTRNEPTQTYNDNQSNQQSQTVTPLEPTRPAQSAQPAKPAQTTQSAQATQPTTANQSSSNQSNNQSSTTVSGNSNASNTTNSKPTTPKVVPKDDSIDMVIIEDDSATY